MLEEIRKRDERIDELERTLTAQVSASQKHIETLEEVWGAFLFLFCSFVAPMWNSTRIQCIGAIFFPESGQVCPGTGNEHKKRGGR